MMLRRQVSLLGSALLLRPLAASLSSSSSSSAGGHPIPPFHYAFPVHDLKAAKSFYGGVMGCSEGRSSVHWQDYN
eukprot:scaffold3693_cov118-Pinguiococcus_pyrenoidosus.AAC.1